MTDDIVPTDEQFVLEPILFLHDDLDEYVEPPDGDATVDMLESTVSDVS